MARKKTKTHLVVNQHNNSTEIDISVDEFSHHSEEDKRTRIEKFKSRLEFLPGIILTEKQKKLKKIIESNDIITVAGPAGSAKTFSIIYTLIELFKNKNFEKIIITKPIRESGEQLGFLPGTMEEKIAPFMESFYHTLNKQLTKQSVKMLTEKGWIEERPLAYMRGISLDNCLMFLDEAQNATIEQLMLITTRLGKDSKLVIAGDTKQTDLKIKESLSTFINIIKDVEGVGSFQFLREDIVRNKILIEIVDKYEHFKYDVQNNKQ